MSLAPRLHVHHAGNQKLDAGLDAILGSVRKMTAGSSFSIMLRCHFGSVLRLGLDDSVSQERFEGLSPRGTPVERKVLL